MSEKSSQNSNINSHNDSSPDYGLSSGNLGCNEMQPANFSFKEYTSESSMAHDLSISDTSRKSLLVGNENNQPILSKEHDNNGNI